MTLTKYDDIKTELEEIQTYLETPFNADNPFACVSRAQDLEIYMARTGRLIADAGQYKDEFVNGAISKTIKDALNDGGWPAKVITDKISALAKDFNHTCTWAERVNRTCTHNHQFMITMVSKHKEEMKMNAFGGGGNYNGNGGGGTGGSQMVDTRTGEVIQGTPSPTFSPFAKPVL